VVLHLREQRPDHLRRRGVSSGSQFTRISAGGPGVPPARRRRPCRPRRRPGSTPRR
jgi:hypothetical protein